jgi:hypothetical protein
VTPGFVEIWIDLILGENSSPISHSIGDFDTFGTSFKNRSNCFLLSSLDFEGNVRDLSLGSESDQQSNHAFAPNNRDGGPLSSI